MEFTMEKIIQGKRKVSTAVSLFTTLCLFCCMFFSSCDFISGLFGFMKTAKVTVHLSSDPLARNLVPDLNLVVASFDLAGEGPGGAAFTATGVTAASYTKSDLRAGEWTVQASGKNAEGTIIVKSASTVVTLISNQTATVALDCVPMVGNGTFGLTLSWPSGILTTAALEGTLAPVTGDAIPLNFTVTGNSATCTKSGLANGYYTLTIKLKDSGKSNYLCWSWNESVLIYKDQTTHGAWTLTASDIDQPGGGVTLTLTSDSKMPITLTLSGNQESLIAGDTMTVKAVGTPTPTSWQWYLDGDLIGGQTSSSITVGAGLTGGTSHSLVVIAKKNDIAGSTGIRFRVDRSRPLTTIDVPDPILRAVFEEKLGKSFASITTFDLTTFTELAKTDTTLADLTGIELCNRLSSLRVSRNPITSIAMLPKLKELRTLNIIGCPVIDFSPIGTMPALRAIRFSPASLADLAWMTPANLPYVSTIGLTNHFGLTYSHALAEKWTTFPLLGVQCSLGLTDTDFIDLYSTVLYPHRATLELFEDYKGSQITNAVTGQFANLTTLKGIDLWFSPGITSLDFIKTMTSLVYVDMESDGITDLTPLKTLYDAGGLRPLTGFWTTPYVDITLMGLDLRTGRPNRLIVDYLLSKGMTVLWQNGNTIE